MFDNIARKPLSFSAGTPAAVRRILSEAVGERSQRFRLHYGNSLTGLDWLDEWNMEGYIGRSTGRQQVPLLVYNRRSFGGPAILTHCVVKIRAARGGAVLWQHPKYHLPAIRLRGGLYERLAWEVLADGKVHAAFHTERERARWLAKMGIHLPAPHDESPESSNRWECPFCGELDSFTGHDDKGIPGTDPDDHDDSCKAYNGKGWTGEECTCEPVTFSQPVRVIRDEDGAAVDFDYGLFLPALYEAEIGSYHRIDCRTCDRQIWAECVFCPSDEERAAGYGDGPCRRCNGTKMLQEGAA